MSVKNSLENKKTRREERANKKRLREESIKAIMDALAGVDDAVKKEDQ